MEEKTRPLYIFLIIFLHLGKEKTLCIFKGGGLYNLQRDNNKSKIYIHLLFTTLNAILEDSATVIIRKII